MPVVFPAGLAQSLQSARVIAVIPARYHSTRLPGKPLALIAGRTMIEHVYRRASQARMVEGVIVATDDHRIAEAVDRFGGTAVLTSEAHPTGTDRLAEVATHLSSEIVVNVQGDEPQVDPDAIDMLVQRLTDRPTEMMSTLRRAIVDVADLANPSVVKLVIDRDGNAIYFSRSAIPFTRSDRTAPARWRHLGLYAYRREFLLRLATLAETPLEQAEGLEQLRVLEHGFTIGTVETATDAIGVDTPEDLERVRRVVEAAAHP